MIATLPAGYQMADRDVNSTLNIVENDHEVVEGEETRKPGPHDVLLGRGGGTNNHEGNVLFRQLVNEHKMRYLASNKVDKPKVAREVVTLWRGLTPPGRFLARKGEGKKGPGSVKDDANVWVEVGDKRAREKASQCLRERTPDVMPYLSQLRQHQDQMTEQGVAMVEQHLSRNRAAGAGLDGVGSMSGRGNAMNQARRLSLPPSAHSSNFGMGMGAGAMRMQDRRTSTPVVSRLQGQQQQAPDMESLMSQQQHVLRQAYTSIERSGDPAAFQMMQNQMGGMGNPMEMQRLQMMQNRMLAQQEQQRAMMGQNGMNMNNLSSPRSSPPAVLSGNFNAMQGGNVQRLSPLQQRQQLLRQEHERLVAERDRLLLQEQAMARRQQELQRQQHLVQQQHLAAQLQEAQLSPNPGQNPSPMIPLSVQLPFGNEAGATELEPLPYSMEELAPLAVLPPGTTTSRGGSPSNQRQSPSGASKEDEKIGISTGTDSQAKEYDEGKESGANKKAKENVKKPANIIEKDSDHNTDKSDVILSPAKSRISVDDKLISPGTKMSDMDNMVDAMDKAAEAQVAMKDYQKNLQQYIANHKITAPNLNFDDDGSEKDVGLAVEGIDTSAWIEQALNDSGDVSFSQGKRNSRPRRNSKFSEMSLSGSIEDMSVALSDMDQSHELSLRDRRMSSNQSIMSELTDFDELDGL